jgi:sterol desaturase/sphingolipid hydroxylase (fatty acid hydroxylase superfamily)
MAPLNFAGAMAKMNLPDYLQWIAAPWPFLLPWLLICTDPLPYLLKPELWQANFLQQLSANAALWFAAYSVAWVVFAGGRLFSATRRLKFNQDMPAASFVLVEAGRSFGGICVLSGYQVFVMHYFTPPPAAGVGVFPTVMEVLAWAGAVSFWADLHFYTTHRLLHVVPWLYKNVHKVYIASPSSSLPALLN